MPTANPDGFPAPDIVHATYDAADTTRAIACYKHFFPAVSGMAILRGFEAVGIVPNQVFGTMDTRPGQVGLTLNSDTRVCACRPRSFPGADARRHPGRSDAGGDLER